MLHIYPMNSDTLNRFWEKVEKTETCWLWKSSKRNKGYGAFVWADDAGRIVQGRAHRFSWEQSHGPIPIGLCVLHHCDVPACVNPEHLFLGSKRDNNQDMCKKGRHVSGGTHCGKNGKYERGEHHHHARLTEETVRNIRRDRLLGISFSELATRYGIGVGHAYRIATRKAWKHVI